MRLYSIQTEKAWKICQSSGILTVVDESFIPDGFQPAYRWMKDQMASRFKNFSGNFPIWGWLRRGFHTNAKSWACEEPMVLLTIDIPKERVLLSDFEAWHFVLNNWFLSKIESDSDREFCQQDKEKSWIQIFEQGPSECGWSGLWQACVDQVYLHEIVNVKSFLNKNL